MAHMKLSELIQVQEAVAPQDIVGGKTSAYYSMAGIGRVLAVLTTAGTVTLSDGTNTVTATIAAGSKVTLQLMQAQDDQGTGAKALGNPVEKVASANGEAMFLTVEAKASDLDLANSYSYVAVQVNSDNAEAVYGAAALVFGDLSFRG